METIKRICKCCGKEFKAQDTSTIFCSVRCKQFFKDTERRNRDRLEIVNQVKKETRLALQNKSYFSLTDAAKFLCVSRNTLYKIIASGGIRPLRFSARTVRISSEDLERYVPIDLTSETNDEETKARLERLTSSQTMKKKQSSTQNVKTKSSQRKGHIRQREIAKPEPIEEDPITDIEVPSIDDPDGWYTYPQLTEITGITSRSIKEYCKVNDIPRRKIGYRTCISKPHWDRVRGNSIDLTPYYSMQELIDKYGLESHYLRSILIKKGIKRIKIGTFAYYEKEGADKALRYRLDGTRANTI